MLKYSEEYWEDVKKVADPIKNTYKLCGKEILITGATGMICSTVVDILWYLREELNINVQITFAGRSFDKMINRFPYLKKDDFKFLEFNTIIDENIVGERFDYIIHGAGNADPEAIMKEPVETIITNVSGLNSLFSVLKEKDSRLLFISSSEVYGRNVGEEPIKEEDYGFVDILNPRASYPNAKRISETLCAAFKEEYGKDSVIVRPGHVYGPSISQSDSRASAEFTRLAAAGENIILRGTGEKVRSYIYTLDCASAIITVLLNGKSVNSYNISNPDTTVSIKEFAEAMAQESGVDIKCDLQGKDVAKKGNLMDNSSINAEKLIGIGWRPVFDLQSGINATLEFFA